MSLKKKRFDFISLTNNRKKFNENKISKRMRRMLTSEGFLEVNYSESEKEKVEVSWVLENVATVALYMFDNYDENYEKITHLVTQTQIPLVIFFLEGGIGTKAFYEFNSTIAEVKTELLLMEPWTNLQASLVSCYSALNAESNADDIIELFYSPKSGELLPGKFSKPVSKGDMVGKKDGLVLKKEKEFRFDCFLAHEWGTSKDNYKTHQQVIEFGEILKSNGMRVWLDDEQMRKNIVEHMMEGVDNSKVILFFLTKRYLQRVNDLKTNASQEFQYAVRKGVESIIPLVLEKELLDPGKWFGLVRYHLGYNLFYDISDDEAIKKNLRKIFNRIENTPESKN